MNTHASAARDPGLRPQSHHYVLGFLGILLVFGAGVAVGWVTRGAYLSASVSGNVGQLLNKSQLPSVTNGLSQLESAIQNENLDQAENALSTMRDAALKQTQQLETQLLSARISKALAAGHVDQAKDLLEKARASGTVAAEQLKKWEDQIHAAEKAPPASDSSGTV